jgi:hypothetical protein
LSRGIPAVAGIVAEIIHALQLAVCFRVLPMLALPFLALFLQLQPDIPQKGF